MRAVRLLLSVVLAVLVTAGLSSVPAAAAPNSPEAPAAPVHYYLALGDSLSQGFMPAHDGFPGGSTDQGYVDLLYTQLKVKDPALQLVKFGCSGETTVSMIRGGLCPYGGISQLQAAELFLVTHGADVRYVTLDIGANDIDSCVTATSFDFGCAIAGATTFTLNFSSILSRLRAAASPTTQLAGMTYYDPYLQFWTAGIPGMFTATMSVFLLASINGMATAQYALYGFRVADVFSAFLTTNFLSPVLFGTPMNVLTVCSWTFMCGSQNDLHANPAGYAVIAKAFAAQLS